MPVIALPTGEVQTIKTDQHLIDLLGEDDGVANRSILFLDDQLEDYVGLAASLAESLNGVVALCRSGGEAGRLASTFPNILLDMGAGAQLDAGVEWLKRFASFFRPDTALVVFTQYGEQVHEFRPELERYSVFRSVVLKSDTMDQKRRKILHNYGARRLVEGYIERYVRRDDVYEVALPSWRYNEVVSVDARAIDSLLDRCGTGKGHGAAGSVVVGRANIFAVDEFAVDFRPETILGHLPDLGSELTAGIVRDAD